ncbi:unnamed protein product, partial [Mycena citricolor]
GRPGRFCRESGRRGSCALRGICCRTEEVSRACWSWDLSGPLVRLSRYWRDTNGRRRSRRRTKSGRCGCIRETRPSWTRKSTSGVKSL